MENKNLELQIQEINNKLDFITEQMRETQRRQRELQELKDDLTLIGKDIFQSVNKELDQVAQHFDTQDLVFLFKKLLRNTRNLNKMMDQVESAADFIKDAAPLGKQIMEQVLETLAEIERKGYFDFFREGFNILDTVVNSFSVEDVKALRENVTTILLTVKNLTQPEMLCSLNNALNFFQKMDVDVNEEISYWDLMKEMRDPELKRGMAFMIRFMKNMVKVNGAQNTNLSETNKTN